MKQNISTSLSVQISVIAQVVEIRLKKGRSLFSCIINNMAVDALTMPGAMVYTQTSRNKYGFSTWGVKSFQYSTQVKI